MAGPSRSQGGLLSIDPSETRVIQADRGTVISDVRICGLSSALNIALCGDRTYTWPGAPAKASVDSCNADVVWDMEGESFYPSGDGWPDVIPGPFTSLVFQEFGGFSIVQFTCTWTAAARCPRV